MRLSGRKGNRWSSAGTARMVDDVLSERARHRRVSEVMRLGGLLVRPTSSLDSATEALVDHGVDVAPVVDDDGRLIGMLTLADSVRDRLEHAEVGEPALPTKSRTRFGVDPKAFHTVDVDRCVEDVMRTDVAFLPEGASLARAAAVMAASALPRIAIVDGKSRVIGTLSSLDLLAWWAAQDGFASAAAPAPRKIRRPSRPRATA